jgi:hypothetical protein
MNGHAGQVIGFTQAALTPSTSWPSAGAARPGAAETPEPAEDWTGLERIEQVVARQRHFMVRDLVTAVAFAGLCIAVVVALL